MSLLKHALVSSCALAAVAMAAPAVAADAAGVSATVAELVVTAQMREQQLQDVPISMNVVQGRQLQSLNITDIRGLQTSLPGVFVQTSPTNNGLYLRGFGSSPANQAFDQSVSLYQDDIYAGRTRQFMAPFFDVARVEVLRGPQGALLGKNTAAGAVSIVTNGPTNSFEAGGTGNYNFTLKGVDADGYVSGPLGAGFSARLAVKVTDLDGYFHNLTLGENQPAKNSKLARLSLRYENGAFDITTKFELGRTKNDGNTLQYIPQAAYSELSRNKFGAKPFGHDEFDVQDGYNSSTIANLKLGDYTLTSITGFSGFKSRTDTGAAALNPENFFLTWHEKYTQESQEIRLISPKDRPIEFILGGYYDHSRDAIADGNQYFLFGVLNGFSVATFGQKEDAWSVFAIGTWNITKNLRLLANARYTAIQKNGELLFTQVFGPPIRGAIPGNHQVATVKNNTFDPSATLQWDVTSDLMLYATIARGSKAGGFDPTNGAANVSTFKFSPEQSTNYEVGGKWSFADRALLTVAIYDLEFKNLQVASYVPPFGLETSNAGTARSVGLETTLAWHPVDRLDVQAAASYMDARYTDFPGAPCRATQTLSECNGSAPASASNSQANNNARGIPLNFAPRFSSQLQIQYTWPLSRGLQVVLTGVDSYRGKTWVDSAYNPAFGYQRAGHNLDARVEFGPDDHRWSLALVGKNLTDRITRSYVFAWPLELAPGNRPIAGVVAEQGRTIAIQGTVRIR